MGARAYLAEVPRKCPEETQKPGELMQAICQPFARCAGCRAADAGMMAPRWQASRYLGGHWVGTGQGSGACLRLRSLLPPMGLCAVAMASFAPSFPGRRRQLLGDSHQQLRHIITKNYNAPNCVGRTQQAISPLSSSPLECLFVRLPVADPSRNHGYPSCGLRVFALVQCRRFPLVPCIESQHSANQLESISFCRSSHQADTNCRLQVLS
jgi:hypothetical protein